MAYRVQILARFGEFSDEDNSGKVIYEGVFTDEGAARKAMASYIDDVAGKLKVSVKFQPDYFTANIFNRGVLADNWELVYSESLPL